MDFCASAVVQPPPPTPPPTPTTPPAVELTGEGMDSRVVARLKVEECSDEYRWYFCRFVVILIIIIIIKSRTSDPSISSLTVFL